jgi:hypothetical protein
MLIKEVIAVYADNCTKHINTKCSVTDSQSIAYSYLSALKG